MKTETSSAKRKRELANIKALGITSEQLYVIRKLNGPRSIRGKRYSAARINNERSKRTIEAVLHGRRFNAEILHAAIEAAKDELKLLVDGLKEIEAVLRSKVTR